MKTKEFPSNQKSFVRNSGKGTAALRAIETQKGINALIKDEYAHLLAGEQGFTWVNSLPEQTRLFFIDMLAVRTRIFDDYCRNDVPLIHHDYPKNESHCSDAQENSHHQIVIIGAGYDTRAYRLEKLIGKSVYEVDFPEVLSEKKHLLSLSGAKPLCARHVNVNLDVSKHNIIDVLLKNEFDRQLPTFWLIEALTGYLTLEENQEMFKQITELSQSGSLIVSTFVGESREAFGQGSGASKKHLFFTDKSYELFEPYGWNVSQRRINMFAEVYRRAKFLHDYDYWITEARL